MQKGEFYECDEQRKAHTRKAVLTTTALERANAEVTELIARLSTLEPPNSRTRFGTIASEDTATTSNAPSSPLRRSNDRHLEHIKILEKELNVPRL